MFLVSLLFLGLFLAFSSAFAEWTSLEIDWPPSPGGTDLTTSSDLTLLVQYIYEWGIALGGLAAFIALLIAGFIYLTSVGDPQKMADARGRIAWALAGLVLLLASWIVLNTINPDLTTLTFGCDTDADCPSGYICNGDPHPGDGKKQGACIPFSASLVCNKDSDCPSGHTCTDQNQDDENRDGVCALSPEKDKPSCGYARLHENENWTEPSIPIKLEEKKSRDLDLTTKSIASFFDDSGYNGSICSYDPNPGDRKKEGICNFSGTSCDIDNDCPAPTIKCSNATSGTCSLITGCDWNTDKNKCYQNCGEDACGCTIKLWQHPGIWSCGDEIITVKAYDANLYKYRSDPDDDISCVQLFVR